MRRSRLRRFIFCGAATAPTHVERSFNLRSSRLRNPLSEFGVRRVMMVVSHTSGSRAVPSIAGGTCRRRLFLPTFQTWVVPQHAPVPTDRPRCSMSDVWIGDEARTLLSCAIAHAEAGYPVIPLWPRNKCRRTPAGTAASADLRQVRDWWRRWPDSNVGVVISGLRVMVLDVDGPLGEVSLQTLLEQAGSTALPETYTVTTGRARRWSALVVPAHRPAREARQPVWAAIPADTAPSGVSRH